MSYSSDRFVCVLAIVVISITICIDADPNVNQLFPTTKAFANAVDISSPVTQTSFNCYKSNNVQTVFIRAYMPNGLVDTDAALNVRYATQANLGVEVFMSPQASSSKQCAQQFTETYNYLTNNAITVRAIWLQVTQPISWPNSVISNQNFIISCIQQANSLNLAFGIYTNNYDWNQITGGWTNWIQYNRNIKLWYWNNNGNGPSGATPSNYNDFAPFSGFTTPVVKQYAVGMSLCSTIVNYDVYTTGKVDENRINDNKPNNIVVGGYV